MRASHSSRTRTLSFVTYLCLAEHCTSFSSRTPKRIINKLDKISTYEKDNGFDVNAWKNGYTNCPKEIPPTVIRCKIPKDFPVGTYYRNGHGRFESDDGVKTIHMFDGDGLMNAVTFDPKEQKVLFRNRFVRTEGYVMDIATGKMSKRGVFGTMRSGGFWTNFFQMDVKNVANTNVVYHARRLFALWEGGRPYELDPLTLKNNKLDAKGSDMDGLLSKHPEFGAHPRIDPESGTLVNFGYTVDILTGMAKVRLYELDSKLRSKRSEEVSFIFNGPVLLHDFAITKNWQVFVLNFGHIHPGNILKAIFGTGSFANTIKFYEHTKETYVVLVPRMKDLEKGTATKMHMMNDPRIKVVHVPHHFNFHFSNAFEDSDGNVIFDSAQQDENDLGMSLLESSNNKPLWESALFSHLYPTKLVRYKISPDFECMYPGTQPRVLNVRAPEFLTIPDTLSTKKHRYVYALGSHRELAREPGERGSGPPGSVLKVDTENPELSEVFTYESYEFAGEVSFVPKVGVDVTEPEEEDCGYLVHFVSNGRDMTTDLVIFNVQGKGSLEKGPVSRTTMPTFIPHGLHGVYVEGLTFDFDKSEMRP